MGGGSAPKEPRAPRAMAPQKTIPKSYVDFGTPVLRYGEGTRANSSRTSGCLSRKRRELRNGWSGSAMTGACGELHRRSIAVAERLRTCPPRVENAGLSQAASIEPGCCKSAHAVPAGSLNTVVFSLQSARSGGKDTVFSVLTLASN